MTTDPFLWLEEDTPETLAWEAAEDAATSEYLDRWPHRDALRTLLAAMPSSRGRHVPRVCNSVWFTANGALRADGVVIVDPGARGETLTLGRVDGDPQITG